MRKLLFYTAVFILTIMGLTNLWLFVNEWNLINVIAFLTCGGVLALYIINYSKKLY